MFKRRLIVVAAAILGLSGCLSSIEESFDKIEGINKIQWEPTFAAPLIKTRLTISDFLKQTSTAFIEVDPDNLIHVIYRGELASLKAKDFVSIPKQHFEGAIALLPFHITQLNTNGSTNVNFSTIFNFGIANTEIDSLIMSACAMTTKLTSNLQHDVTVEVSIPEITLSNGTPLTILLSMPYGGAGSVTSNITRDLKQSSFDLTKSGDQTYGQLLAEFKITVTKVGSNPISVNDKIDFETDFLYNEYEVLFGFVGESDISPDQADSIHFDLFRGVDSAFNNVKFRIADPQITFYISNSYGIPITAKIDEFSTISKTSGKLTATGYPDPLVIPTPSRLEIGQTKVDSFVLNRSNSNIADLVSNVPQWMIYNFAAQVNPPGTTERNFITYNSELKIETAIDIPLHGSTEGFVINKEVDIASFTSDLEGVDELEEITLRLYLENDFPVDVDLQVYFQDSMGNNLDSLIEPNQFILRSSVVDGDGKTIEPSRYTVDFKISRSRFDQMREASKGLVRAKLNTYNGTSPQPDVKFYDDYGITVKLGIQAHGIFTIDK